MENIDLLDSGRPALVEGEVELGVHDSVELEPKNFTLPEVRDFANARFVLRLTTHRITAQTGRFVKQIQLKNIKQIEPQQHGWVNYSVHFTLKIEVPSANPNPLATTTVTSPLASNRNLITDAITMTNPQPGTLTNPNNQSPKQYQLLRIGLLKINDKRDDFINLLAQQIKAKAWEKVVFNPLVTNKPGSQKNEPTFSTAKAGISGIIKHQEEKHQVIEATLTEAFNDLRALMDNARTLVALAQRLKESHTPSEEEASNDILLKVGLVSAVTKESAGSLFHVELAKQLCDFLKAPLEANGGIMMLADVYCLYNRARGSSLISPDDLLRACNLLDDANETKPSPKSLGLPLQFRRFDSGLKAVQWKSFSDSAFLEKLKTKIEGFRSANSKAQGSGSDPIAEYFPLTTTQFAQAEKMSIALATQFLLKAESLEILCRDDSFEGLMFYPNDFPLLSLKKS